MKILNGFKPRKIEWHTDPKTGQITGSVGTLITAEIMDNWNGTFWGCIEVGDKPESDSSNSIESMKAALQAKFDKLCKTEFQYYFERE